MLLWQVSNGVIRVFPKCLLNSLNSVITRMHSSGMRTVRSSSRLSRGGVCLSACCDTGLPRSIPPPGPGTPQTRHLPGSRPPYQAHPLPQSRPPQTPRPVARHARIPPAMYAGIAHPPETCCKACWDTTCNACWDTTPLWTDTHL